jgi:hypothetical protein
MKTYWRCKTSVAMAANDIDEDLLRQRGYEPIEPSATYPAAHYYLPGDYDQDVDPRRWERETGLRVARRTEYCPTCGRHKGTECFGHSRPMGRVHRDGTVDITPTIHPGRRCFWRHPNGAVGCSTDVKGYLAYQAAGYHRTKREDLPTYAPVYSWGSPDAPTNHKMFWRNARGIVIHKEPRICKECKLPITCIGHNGREFCSAQCSSRYHTRRYRTVKHHDCPQRAVMLDRCMACPRPDRCEECHMFQTAEYCPMEVQRHGKIIAGHGRDGRPTFSNGPWRRRVVPADCKNCP